MSDLNTGPQSGGSYFETVVLSALVKLVHNKIFPTIVLIIFSVFFYSFLFRLEPPLGFAVMFVTLSIPGLIALAFYLYGLCDLAPNMYEAYKRFKREFSPDKNGDT
ncbi:MAG: hypothetical protein WC748_08455 [Legionellales bacterium]|jgi:hypothetical protein